jgi:hypothetical protein
MGYPVPEGNESFLIVPGDKLLKPGLVAVSQNYGVISGVETFLGKGNHPGHNCLLGSAHQFLAGQGTLPGQSPENGERQ